MTESKNRFSIYYDLSQRASVDTIEQAESLEVLLRSQGVASILDTACGTGLPSLELRRRGFQVDCCDGEPTMIELFRQRARLAGVDDTCAVAHWQDLHIMISKQYDCLLCLGNSLIYNDLWMGRSPQQSIVGHYDVVFHNFRQALKIGGYLYIDAPRTFQSMPLHEISVNLDLRTFTHSEPSDETVTIRVREIVHELRNARFWDCHISARTSPDTPGYSYNFVRYSHKMTINDFKEILARFGFGNFFELPSKSGRATHAALVAQRIS